MKTAKTGAKQETKARRRTRRWCVYLLRLRDGSLYCGITIDLPKRLALHNSGRGAKCIVPSKRPALVVYMERVRGHSAALRRERAIKSMRKARKEALASGQGRLASADSGE